MNTVLIPAIEYQLQGVVLKSNECKYIMAYNNKVIKHKANLQTSTPNNIITKKFIWGENHISFKARNAMQKHDVWVMALMNF